MKIRKSGPHKDRMMQSLNDLWKYVDIKGDGECWSWTRATNSTGYGSVRIDGRKVLVHRIAFLSVNGGITLDAPQDRKGSGFVMHSCDNRLCCNPSHLSIGTYDKNNKDKQHKGRCRPPRGDSHPKAALTNAQAAEIRAMLKNGRSRKEARERFNVSERIVDRIAIGKGYADAEA